MAQTPSNRRRKGRNDFDPNTDPMDVQPYNPKSWYYESHLQDWLDGWEQAEKEYEVVLAELEDTKEDLICPHCGNLYKKEEE